MQIHTEGKEPCLSLLPLAYSLNLSSQCSFHPYCVICFFSRMICKVQGVIWHCFKNLNCIPKSQALREGIHLKKLLTFGHDDNDNDNDNDYDTNDGNFDD